VTEAKIIELEEIVEGEDLFRSSGYSYIKVTRNGEVEKLKVPIQSTGIAELVDSFSEKAPKPPIIDELAKPDNQIGKDLGVTKSEWVKIPDYSDETYLQAKEKHESDLGIAIVLKGITFRIKDKEGNEVTDSNKKVDIMRSMGMSGDQFSQIVEDIQNLTRWTEEERENFLE